MAVVQISRIQIRRGQANVGTGLPQLASGEMAWAIDTQELWIGNGAVSEGSPGVGNTKILTQNDLSSQGNLLGLLEYVYKPTDTTILKGPDANNPATRSVQERLDDRVNLLDFYEVNLDSSSDFTVVLQRAIDQLFLNINHPAHNSTQVDNRIILELPAGEFYTSEPLYIPSYTTIVGAGAEKTKIIYDPTIEVTSTRANNSNVISTTLASQLMIGASISGGNIAAGTYIVSAVDGVSITLSAGAVTGESTATLYTIVPNKPAIQFVNDLSVPGTPSPLSATPSDKAPRYIQIKGITVETVPGANIGLQLDAVQNSVFENINLVGNWAVGDTNENYSRGIDIKSKSDSTRSENNIFKNVNIDGFYYAVYAKYDIMNNVFDTTVVTDSKYGFVLGGDADFLDVRDNNGNPDVADGTTTGQQFGPRQTSIINSRFENIYRQGVIVSFGSSNSVKDSKFVNVGNNGAGVAGTQYPIVYFASHGNTTENIYTDRHTNLARANPTEKYIPEFAGYGVYKSFGTSTVTNMTYNVSPVKLFRLPAPTNQYGAVADGVVTSYKIDYYYYSTQNNYSRRGTITLHVDVINKAIQLSDEFDYIGNNGTTDSLLLDFSAVFLDELGNSWTSLETIGSVQIYYSNAVPSDAGYLVYSYTAQS